MIDVAAFSELGHKVAGLTITAIQTVNYNGFGPANTSGATAASIMFRMTARGVDIVRVGPPANSVMTLVYGRGPTVGDGSGALRPRIKEWLQQKNFVAPEDIEGASYAITKSIHKKGTNLYQKGRPSDIFAALTSPEVMEEAAAAAKKSLLLTLFSKN